MFIILKLHISPHTNELNDNKKLICIGYECKYFTKIYT